MGSPITFQSPKSVDASATSPAPLGGFRRAAIRGSEWVIFLFLACSGAEATFAPINRLVSERIIVFNLLISLIYVLLVRLESRYRSIALSVTRDWLPLAALLFAYQEMGWFAHPLSAHTLETVWVGWDRAFLHGGASAAIETFGPVLPSILEISYTLVYAIAAFCLVVLYLYRRRDRVERLLFPLTIATLLCYAQFPFWPSEPPRVVFAGQDLPGVDTVFRHFNLWMLSKAGIHTSVFPSAHVAAAFACAFGMRRALPDHKWLGRLLLAMALSIALATVYGRYHYLADAAAGFVMALVAFSAEMAIRRSRPKTA